MPEHAIIKSFGPIIKVGGTSQREVPRAQPSSRMGVAATMYWRGGSCHKNYTAELPGLEDARIEKVEEEGNTRMAA